MVKNEVSAMDDEVRHGSKAWQLIWPSGVIFDVDGTLYHQSWLRLIMGTSIVLSAVLRPKRALRHLRIIRHYRKAQESLRSDENVRMGADSQISRAAVTLGISPGEVRECVTYWMEEKPLSFLRLCSRRWLLKMINHWRALGVPMAVYSDYPVKEKLKALRIESAIQWAVCSTDSEVAVFKPHPRGFQVAATKMGLAPQNVVYIGDRQDTDVTGAKRAGMRVLLVGRSREENQMGEAPLTLLALDAKFCKIYGRSGL